MKAILALEDGTIFEGASIGATGTVTGEACFNTAVMGYQEILTDPTYRGQILAMTYSLIGNYGIVPAPVALKALPEPWRLGFFWRTGSKNTQRILRRQKSNAG